MVDLARGPGARCRVAGVVPRGAVSGARRAAAWLAAAAAVCVAVRPQVDARQAIPPATCRIEGLITSAGAPIPGVAVVVTGTAGAAGATSTDPDGTYSAHVRPGSYRVTAELAGFAASGQDVVLAGDPCAVVRVDFQLAIGGRSAAVRVPAAPVAAAGAPQAGNTSTPGRFESVSLQEQSAGASLVESTLDRDAEENAARLLLPPGFAGEGPAQALTINGNMANVDRGLLGDRLEAMARGEFDRASGEIPPGFGLPRGQGAAADRGGPATFGGRGGPGTGGPFGGAGGPRGRGDFAIGGRGGRQNTYTGTADYAVGGSALDAAPYRLRDDSPAGRAPYTRQNFGGTFGGPVRIPRVYNGTRRTNFIVTYSANRGDELFDQYATVPTDAMRLGDFSATGARLVDPRTGQILASSQIPASLLDPSALALLRFIPSANLPGLARNYHYTSTTDSAGDNISARITHNFTPSVAGGGRGRGGFAGRGGGRGGRGRQGTSVLLNAQVQYRRSAGERLNVFPTLGGVNESSSLALPIGLNVARRAVLHNFSLNLSRTTSTSRNRYANVEDVAGAAGIRGVAEDAFDWGVPDLSFSSVSNVRDLTPSERADRRVTAGYTWSRPIARHTVRVGGDFRWDRSASRTDANARGAFVFTGLYASGGSPSARGDGLDFADFLFGLPQQATVNYGPGNVQLTGRSLSLFLQDDWRRSSGLTFNLGVRYELLWPFVERHGRMVNLDAAPDFGAVVPVLAGETGPYSGRFPSSLLAADTNNIAPRVGAAWRIAPGTVLRGGYGISFNAGTYSSIAREMVSQAPFAVTNTALGAPGTPLALSDPLATATPGETTNTFGVRRDYALGTVQTWNADISRDVRQVWNVGASYTHTRGSSLDILRAPNRGPDGLRIPNVQPFLWESSEGSSILHAAAFRARRRPVRGVGAGVTYTLARSRDNASSIGGGGTVVAQDDRDLDAEWGLSSFDRRHQLALDVQVELPFGPNRRWLNNGGLAATLLANWRMTTNLTWQSGTPYTPRIRGAAADVARGTNGTLRARYDGGAVQVPNPTIDLFFNTAAFSMPEPGTFGNAPRNMIIGPGSRQLNAQFSRDVRIGRTRTVTVGLNATNLLNLVNYAAIDTVVNSPTFGQVLSVRPMRSMRATLRVRF